MSLENIVLLALAIVIFVYLGFALVRPERF